MHNGRQESNETERRHDNGPWLLNGFFFCAVVAMAFLVDANGCLPFLDERVSLVVFVVLIGGGLWAVRAGWKSGSLPKLLAVLLCVLYLAMVAPMLLP